MDAVTLAKQMSDHIAQIGRDLGLEPEDRQGPKVILVDTLADAIDFLDHQIETGGTDPCQIVKTPNPENAISR